MERHKAREKDREGKRVRTGKETNEGQMKGK